MKPHKPLLRTTALVGLLFAATAGGCRSKVAGASVSGNVAAEDPSSVGGRLALPGVEVRLLDREATADAGAPPAAFNTTTTDAEGSYAFRELPEGSYRVTPVPYTGDDWFEVAADSDPTSFSVGPGEQPSYRVDFLLRVPANEGERIGGLMGTVRDLSGAALPGVEVRAFSPALVVPMLSTMGNSTGAFRFPLLPEGIYELQLTADGLQKLVQKGITVRGGAITRLDLVMTP